MVLAHSYSTVSTDIPRNIPGNIPPLARAIEGVAVNAYVGQKCIEFTALEIRRQKFGDYTWMEMHRISDFDFLASSWHRHENQNFIVGNA